MSLSLINKLVKGKEIWDFTSNGGGFRIEEVLSIDDDTETVTMLGIELIGYRDDYSEVAGQTEIIPFRYFSQLYPRLYTPSGELVTGFEYYKSEGN